MDGGIYPSQVKKRKQNMEIGETWYLEEKKEEIGSESKMKSKKDTEEISHSKPPSFFSTYISSSFSSTPLSISPFVPTNPPHPGRVRTRETRPRMKEEGTHPTL
jgi:hypothetical protein